MNPPTRHRQLLSVPACLTLAAQPPNLTELEPNAKIPYQIQYGLSIERQLGEKATGIDQRYSARGIDSSAPSTSTHRRRSRAIRRGPIPPTAASARCSPHGFFAGSGLDISYRGKLNKYFTGFGRYTWSHYESNTGGIGWFPQNQYAPDDEWSNAGWDRRHRLGMYAIFHPESLLNLSAGIFANTGTPWTIVTGTDLYGDDLFNARPEGVGRNYRDQPWVCGRRPALGPRVRLTAEQG